MAYDKKVDSSALNANLTAVANAIREKAGVTDSFAFPAGFVSAIANIAPGSDLKVIVDETITVSMFTSTSAKTIYTSSELKNLDWYAVYLYQENTRNTTAHTEFFACSGSPNQIAASDQGDYLSSVTRYDAITIDTSGNLKLKPYSSSLRPNSGSYRLLIVA